MTSIEWVKNPDGTQGITWNPITGCLNHISGLCKGGGFPCYAYKLAHGRLKQRYLANDQFETHKVPHDVPPGLDPFYPRFWEERLSQPIGYATTKQVEGVLTAIPPKGKGIFVCDMSDLFGIGIPEEWTRKVLRVIEHTSYNRYYLLTKQAQRLPEFSPFPENCWVGVTITSNNHKNSFIGDLSAVQATVKFISIEPLLEWADLPEQRELIPIKLNEYGISWLIIGACTGTPAEMVDLHNRYPDLKVMLWGRKCTAQPRIEWVREIVEAADRAGVKVFLKNNLRPLLIPEDCSKPNYLTEDIFWASEKAQLRQELPK